MWGFSCLAFFDVVNGVFAMETKWNTLITRICSRNVSFRAPCNILAIIRLLCNKHQENTTTFWIPFLSMCSSASSTWNEFHNIRISYPAGLPPLPRDILGAPAHQLKRNEVNYRMFNSTANVKSSLAFRLAAAHTASLFTSTKSALLMPSLLRDMEVVDIISSICIVEEN